MFSNTKSTSDSGKDVCNKESYKNMCILLKSCDELHLTFHNVYCILYAWQSKHNMMLIKCMIQYVDFTLRQQFLPFFYVKS